jgi:Cdc6-like AAA superfamily ATPase
LLVEYTRIEGKNILVFEKALIDSVFKNGDARKAIELLEKSGEIAEAKEKSKVEEEDVREANEKIEIDRVASVVRTLPTQAKLTLYSCIFIIAESSKKH